MSNPTSNYIWLPGQGAAGNSITVNSSGTVTVTSNPFPESVENDLPDWREETELETQFREVVNEDLKQQALNSKNLELGKTYVFIIGALSSRNQDDSPEPVSVVDRVDAYATDGVVTSIIQRLEQGAVVLDFVVSPYNNTYPVNLYAEGYGKDWLVFPLDVKLPSHFVKDRLSNFPGVTSAYDDGSRWSFTTGGQLVPSSSGSYTLSASGSVPVP